MKKHNYFYLFLFVWIILSCDDYLDVIPDNLATLDLAFSDRYSTEGYLFTCYSSLPSPSDVTNNPALRAGDEIWLPDYHKDSPGPIVARGFQNAYDPRFKRWSGGESMYLAIRKCNIFIDNIDKVQGLDQYLKDSWKAEAMVLKAYYHFYLMRMYGPVIIVDKAVPVSVTIDKIRKERNTIDECFSYVIELLDAAMVNLPETLQSENDDLGRITKPIATSIKARVLMTYASPLFNGNPDYTSITNSDGKPLFPSAYDKSKWERAAVACKEAIDLCEAAGIRLYTKDDFSSPFPQNDTTMLKAALRSRVTERWNKEIIWAHTSNTSTIQHDAMPRLYSYTKNPVGSGHVPTLRIAEMYYSENGVPIDEDIYFNYNNRYKTKQASSKDRFYIESGKRTAILNFNREARFYADLAFDRGTWFGNGKNLDTDPWYIHARKGEFASISEISRYSVTGYWPKKLVNLKTTVKNGTSFSPYRYTFPIIRLADLYLYYAEALNESGGAEVYQYIDKVRERAGLKAVVNSWVNFSKQPEKPLSKEGLRKIIQGERLIELSFEGGRFWDLRRWKLADRYMNKPIKGWSVLQQDLEDYYTVRVLYNPSFSAKDYLWPIAEGELKKNPKLVQNPGW